MNNLELLIQIEFTKKWETKDLYNEISSYYKDFKEKNKNKFKEDFYGYIMIIHGYYDKSLCDDNRFRELIINSKEYNSLLNDKDNCIYLVSEYPDFRKYRILKTTIKNKSDLFSNIKIYGLKRNKISSFIHKLINKF